MDERPMITSKDIQRSGYNWCMSNDVSKTASNTPYGTPFIVNTDKKGFSGVHWLCIVICKDGKSAFIFDPLGPHNDRVASDGDRIDQELLSELSRIVPKENIRIYNHKTQYQHNTLCGWHSLYACQLVDKIIKENPKANATTIASEFAKKLDKRPSEHNVRLTFSAFS